MSKLAINFHLVDKDLVLISKNFFNSKTVVCLSKRSNYSTTKPKRLRKVNERRD